MSRLFSMKGRLNRARYFGYSIAILLATYFVAFVAGMIIGIMALTTNGIESAQSGTTGAAVVGFMIGICGSVVIAFQAVKRLHDMGRPGVHYWLLLIPIYNIYLGLLLLFQKGDSGPNQYGPDPLQPVQTRPQTESQTTSPAPQVPVAGGGPDSINKGTF
jgi:uncharacterized membrane protein YhaH (DUF805 family)